MPNYKARYQFVTIVKTMASDQTVDNSTTLINEPTLQTPLEIGKYLVQFHLRIKSHATPDIKIQFASLSGTMTGTVHPGDNYIGSLGKTSIALDTNIAFTCDDTNQLFVIWGLVRVTASGIFGLKWAQNVATVNPSLLQQDSTMIIYKGIQT